MYINLQLKIVSNKKTTKCISSAGARTLGCIPQAGYGQSKTNGRYLGLIHLGKVHTPSAGFYYIIEHSMSSKLVLEHISFKVQQLPHALWHMSLKYRPYIVCE